MKLLYLLESLRTPAGDWLMSGITHLGGETAFLAVAIFIFWCVDKHEGYYLLTVGFLGTVLNQFLKLLCRIPRPWVLDPDFTIVESARAEATGYSFPSGHSTPAASTTRKYRTAPASPALPPKSAMSGAFSPALSATTSASPTINLIACTHQTAFVSKWTYCRSSHHASAMPSVAPRSFQPFSTPLARFAESISGGKG